MSERQIFTIYVHAGVAAALGAKAVRRYWRDQVTAQDGTPVKGCSIIIRRFGNRCSVSGLVERE